MKFIHNYDRKRMKVSLLCSIIGCIPVHDNYFIKLFVELLVCFRVGYWPTFTLLWCFETLEWIIALIVTGPRSCLLFSTHCWLWDHWGFYTQDIQFFNWVLHIKLCLLFRTSMILYGFLLTNSHYCISGLLIPQSKLSLKQWY